MERPSVTTLGTGTRAFKIKDGQDVDMLKSPDQEFWKCEKIGSSGELADALDKFDVSFIFCLGHSNQGSTRTTFLRKPRPSDA